MNFGVAEEDLIPVKEQKLIKKAIPDYADLSEATAKYQKLQSKNNFVFNKAGKRKFQSMMVDYK